MRPSTLVDTTLIHWQGMAQIILFAEEVNMTAESTVCCDLDYVAMGCHHVTWDW